MDMSKDRFAQSDERGLWPPYELAGVQLPSAPAWVKSCATWRDLSGQSVKWDDVANRLSQFGLGQVLRVLGGVSAVLESSDTAIEGQRSIVKNLFDDPSRVGQGFQACWNRLKRDGVSDPLLFFTDAQVVAATKIALLACEPVTTTTDASPQPIGEALIMTTDLVGQDEEGSGLPVPDLDSPVSNETWLRYIAKNMLFNTSDQFEHALVRSYCLYTADGADGSMDMLGRFEDLTGLDLFFAWAIGACLREHWQSVDLTSHWLLDPVNLEAFGSPVNTTKAETESLRRLFSVDAQSARRCLRERGCGPGSLQLYDLNPLDRRPLIHIEGDLYCPSMKLLSSKLTTGLHHVFLQEDRATNRFQICVGHRFEDHVELLFERASPPVGPGRYMNERTLRKYLPDGNCDGLILYGDAVVMIECKAKLLRYDVRARGDLEMLRTKIDHIFGRAAEQFDATVRGIEEGRLEGLVQPEEVSRYLPLVITLETLPVEPLFYRAIEDEVSRGGALSFRKVRPMQVLSVTELELLEGWIADGGRLGALLDERLDNRTWRDCSMTSYLLERGRDRMFSTNRFLRRRGQEISKYTVELMRERAGGRF